MRESNGARTGQVVVMPIRGFSKPVLIANVVAWTASDGQAARLTIPLAMFGLAGVPRSTSFPSTSAPTTPILFLKRTTTGPTYGTLTQEPSARPTSLF